MYNIVAKRVPSQKWFDYDCFKKLNAEQVVKAFNESGKKLILSFYEEPSDTYELDCMLEEGMFEFIYPDCPEAEALRALVEEAEKFPRYLGFDVEDMDI